MIRGVEDPRFFSIFASLVSALRDSALELLSKQRYSIVSKSFCCIVARSSAAARISLILVTELWRWFWTRGALFSSHDGMLTFVAVCLVETAAMSPLDFRHRE